MAYKIVTPSKEFLKELASSGNSSRARMEFDLSSARGRTAHVHNLIQNSTNSRNSRRSCDISAYHILHNLTTFIIDENDFDEDHFKNLFDAVVYDNFVVSSISPSETINEPQTKLPDFWHKNKLNISSLNLTGKNINVGVLDSGIDSSHQEFEGKTIKFAEFDTLGKLKGIVAKDYGTHGTHVCGLLAGKNAGIAPDISLTVVACLTEKGGTAGYLAQILGGLNYLLEQGLDGNENEKIHLINASIEASIGYNDYLHTSLTHAISDPGTLMVAAIGNNGSQGVGSDSSPGNYDLTIGVGALDENDKVASFSSWGTVPQFGMLNKPDLSAPGVWVYSSLSGPGNRYFKQSGTSMASPIVAGMAALLLEREPDLLLQPLNLKQRLLDLVVPLTDTVRAGKGRINL